MKDGKAARSAADLLTQVLGDRFAVTGAKADRDDGGARVYGSIQVDVGGYDMGKEASRLRSPTVPHDAEALVPPIRRRGPRPESIRRCSSTVHAIRKALKGARSMDRPDPRA
jgi:hypothetical protein